jgi:hypothetical protein
MEKPEVMDHVERTADAHSFENEGRRGSVAKDAVAEHELKFMDVLKHHKMLIWWSFYFAMCAVGWYVPMNHHIYRYTDNPPGALTPKSTEP